MADKKKLRFSVRDDIVLLRETVAQNPFEDTSKWKQITSIVVEATGKNFSLRAVREHVDYLISLWIKEDMGNLRKSGTEEQYGEKEQLLVDAKFLKEEFQKNKPKKKTTRDVDVQTKMEAIGSGMGIPEFYEQTEQKYLNVKNEIYVEDGISMHSVNSEGEAFSQDPLNIAPELEDAPSASASTPSTTGRSSPATPGTNNFQRKRKNNTLVEYLKEKLMCDRQVKDKEIVMEEKKIEIEERKIALEEEKVKMNYREMEARLEMERTEQEHRIRIAEEQQTIIKLLIEKLKDKE